MCFFNLKLLQSVTDSIGTTDTLKLKHIKIFPWLAYKKLIKSDFFVSMNLTFDWPALMLSGSNLVSAHFKSKLWSVIL